MNRPAPTYLKLRSGNATAAVRPDLADLACLGELCQAFSEATGWPLRFVSEPEAIEDIDLLWSAPVNPGVGVPPGHLRIDLSTASELAHGVRANWHACERMAGAVAELVNELVTARVALWQREAELAACVPVVSHRNEESHLAQRLTATLRAGATAIGCRAAAIYLLDESTSQLKLRSSWGLPAARLTQPARPLADQMVDLEALLGHAVALESVSDMEASWRSPEAAEAALCVPISSPTVPLGTLWFFCDRQRTFTNDHTNLAEIVAGRIAADLERSALLRDSVSHETLQRQAEAVQKLQQHQAPAAPPLAGWSISGSAEQRGPIGGAFYDWRMIDESSLLVVLGDSCQGGLEAAIASSALRASFRSADDKAFNLKRILTTANRVLWESGAGAWSAGLVLAHVDLSEGTCSFVAAGRPEMIWMRADGWSSLITPWQPLGVDATIGDTAIKRIRLHHGDSLLVYNRAFTDSGLGATAELRRSMIARALLCEPDVPAERMVEIIRELLGADAWTQDLSMLIIKRLASI